MINLKELRIKKGYTQKKLANTCGVARQTISNIECGVNKPSVELAQKLAFLFDVEWKEFFEG